MCEALNLSWSIVRGEEGSTSKADGVLNKNRERLMVLFPQDLDGLPDLVEDQPPPFYTDQKEEDTRLSTAKRNIYDQLSMKPPGGHYFNECQVRI
jgi:hypothetical protein